MLALCPQLRCISHGLCSALLAILTGQGDISKVIVFSETFKCIWNIFLKIIPLQAKLFRHCQVNSRNWQNYSLSKPLKVQNNFIFDCTNFHWPYLMISKLLILPLPRIKVLVCYHWDRWSNKEFIIEDYNSSNWLVNQSVAVFSNWLWIWDQFNWEASIKVIKMQALHILMDWNIFSRGVTRSRYPHKWM